MDVRKHREAEIKDFRFRDLRHSAASYLAMNGASLAEVLDHKTHQMVAHHAHLSDEHIVDVGARMNSNVFDGSEK